MVALNFNAQQVAPNAALEPLPSGTYDVMITNTEEKPTKDGTGSYVQFEMTVQGGTMNGRKVFDRLNIRNKSAQAVEIAYGTLSAICHVTGRYQIQDTGQLHGIPFKVVVAKVARDDKPGEYSNEVKGYKDQQGNDPGQGGGGAAPQQNGGAPQQSYGGQPQQQNYGGQPQQGNYGGPAPGQQNGPQPHQGPGGQSYPDPAHSPQQGAGQNNYGNNGQPAPGQGQPQQGQPQGGPPAWANPAGGQPQGGAPQPQAGGQPQHPPQQPPQGQATPGQFQPGGAPPWANASA